MLLPQGLLLEYSASNFLNQSAKGVLEAFGNDMSARMFNFERSLQAPKDPLKKTQLAAGLAAGAEAPNFLRKPPKAHGKAVMGVSANPEKVIQSPDDPSKGGPAKRGGKRRAAEGSGEGGAKRGRGRGRGAGRGSEMHGGVEGEQPSAGGKGRGRGRGGAGKVGKLRKKHERVVKGRVVGARDGMGGSSESLASEEAVIAVVEDIMGGSAHEEVRSFSPFLISM